MVCLNGTFVFLEFFSEMTKKAISDLCFFRLCPYFRGFHHLEEIMWRENVSRDDITKVLKKYQHILVLVHHEGFDQQSLS
jgi:hypothetical protein